MSTLKLMKRTVQQKMLKMVLFKMLETKFKVTRVQGHYIRPEVDARLNQTVSTLKTLFEQ